MYSAIKWDMVNGIITLKCQHLILSRLEAEVNWKRLTNTNYFWTCQVQIYHHSSLTHESLLQSNVTVYQIVFNLMSRVAFWHWFKFLGIFYHFFHHHSKGNFPARNIAPEQDRNSQKPANMSVIYLLLITKGIAVGATTGGDSRAELLCDYINPIDHKIKTFFVSERAVSNLSVYILYIVIILNRNCFLQMTWDRDAAQDYCRTNTFDLMTTESNAEVAHVARTWPTIIDRWRVIGYFPIKWI